MEADTQIKKWAGKKLNIDFNRIENVSFIYNEAWTSEAGTYWPSESIAVVVYRGNGKSKRKYSKNIYIDNFDTAEFIREIIES